MGGRGVIASSAMLPDLMLGRRPIEDGAGMYLAVLDELLVIAGTAGCRDSISCSKAVRLAAESLCG